MYNQISIDPFNSIKDDNEKILWRGKPHFTSYIFSGLGKWPWVFLFGILLILILPKIKADYNVLNGRIWMIGLIPISQSLFFFFKRLLFYKNTLYSLSTKRILIKSGFLVNTIKSIDLDQIKDIQVSINLIEKTYGTGTIKFYCGTIHNNDGMISKIYDTWISIANPHEVFKLVSKSW